MYLKTKHTFQHRKRACKISYASLGYQEENWKFLLVAKKKRKKTEFYKNPPTVLCLPNFIFPWSSTNQMKQCTCCILFLVVWFIIYIKQKQIKRKKMVCRRKYTLDILKDLTTPIHHQLHLSPGKIATLLAPFDNPMHFIRPIIKQKKHQHVQICMNAKASSVTPTPIHIMCTQHAFHQAHNQTLNEDIIECSHHS